MKKAEKEKHALFKRFSVTHKNNKIQLLTEPSLISKGRVKRSSTLTTPNCIINVTEGTYEHHVLVLGSYIHR